MLGQAADGTADDMRRAIGAARRAFDETDWAVDQELRARCLLQLQEAVESEVEQFRSELVAEVGTPSSRSPTWRSSTGRWPNAFR